MDTRYGVSLVNQHSTSPASRAARSKATPKATVASRAAKPAAAQPRAKKIARPKPGDAGATKARRAQ
jgi:hypothetical protein